MKPARDRLDWARVRESLAQHAVPASYPEARALALEDILKQRSARLRARGAQHARKTARPVLVFALGSTRFGLPLARVAQVFPRPAITPVPGAAPSLLGVAGLAGDIHSVLDPRGVLELARETCDGGYVLVLKSQRGPVGLWVEALDGVHEFESDPGSGLAAADGDAAGRFVESVAEDRLLVLDVDRLVAAMADELAAAGVPRSPGPWNTPSEARLPGGPERTEASEPLELES